jgi:hypothetical protein
MAGRPKNTQSIIDAIKRQGQLKVQGVKKLELLAQMLWGKALEGERTHALYISALSAA